MAALRREHLLSPTLVNRTRPWLAIAAALLVFVAGWAIGEPPAATLDAIRQPRVRVSPVR